MNTKAKEKYFAELFPLAHTLARIQQERQTYKSRMIEYKEVRTWPDFLLGLTSLTMA